MVHILNLSKGIVRYKDRYLILKKKRDTVSENIGKWEAPGGKIQENEDPKEAMLREILEETSLKCEIIIELPLLKLKDKDATTICHIFLLNSFSNEIKLSPEHSDYKWILPKEIKVINLTLPKEIIIRYLKLAEDLKNN